MALVTKVKDKGKADLDGRKMMIWLLETLSS